VLDQTYPELECIVVDDASIDDTDQIINTFEDDRLKYFRHEKNKGTSAARNTGIRHSKGGLIAFLMMMMNGFPQSLKSKCLSLRVYQRDLEWSTVGWTIMMQIISSFMNTTQH